MNEIFARWFVTLVVLFAVSACSQATPAAPVEPDGLQPGPESIVTAPADVLQPSVPITDDGGSGVADAEIEKPTDDTVVAEAPRPTAIPDPITAITETRAYIDPDAGFAFDFPLTWSAVEYPGTMATITSFAPDEPGRGGMGRNDTKIDFTVNLAETESDLTAMSAQIRAGTNVLDEQEWTLAGGIPALRMTLHGPGGDEMALLLAVIDGRGLRVHGYGDLALYDPIARTLRAAP